MRWIPATWPWIRLTRPSSLLRISFFTQIHIPRICISQIGGQLAEFIPIGQAITNRLTVLSPVVDDEKAGTTVARLVRLVHRYSLHCRAKSAGKHALIRFVPAQVDTGNQVSHARAKESDTSPISREIRAGMTDVKTVLADFFSENGRLDEVDQIAAGVLEQHPDAWPHGFRFAGRQKIQPTAGKTRKWSGQER
jgi:hypothetical protein